MFKLFLTKKIHIGVFALILITGSGMAQQNEFIPAATSAPADNGIALRSAKEEVLLNRKLAIQLAPIKSEEDLNFFLLSTYGTPNPLDQLSPAARQRFTDSLMFTERGLGSFDFSDLEYELTPTEIYKILYLFGMQHLVPKMEGARIETRADEVLMQKNKGQETNKDEQQPVTRTLFLCDTASIGIGEGDSCGDHTDYYCFSSGSCKKRSDMICTSNC